MSFTAEQRRLWRELNRDAIRAYHRAWRAANPQPKKPRKLKTEAEKRATQHAYYVAHKDEYQNRARRWRANARNRVEENRRARMRYKTVGKIVKRALYRAKKKAANVAAKLAAE